MTKILSQSQAMRYNRQISLAGFDLDKQEILLNSKVLQIGVGGLGCAAAQYLVASGIGQLTLVDDDIVEQTNLQRQILHGESDIGQTKCLSAQQSLQRLNSDTNIDVIQHRLDDEQLYAVLQEHDIIIDCSDNLATRNQLNQAAFKVHRPLVSGAAIRMEGQICSFLFCANNPCYQCLSSSFLEQDLSCVEAGVMSPIVGIVGSMQALETIKILTDYGQPLTNQLMLFDGLSMQWQKFKISKNAQCSVCGQQNTD